MRTQYHFWPTGTEGLYDAWDVHRLIELARSLPTQEVPLTAITEVRLAVLRSLTGRAAGSRMSSTPPPDTVAG